MGANFLFGAGLIAFMALLISLEIPWIKRRIYRAKVKEYATIIPAAYARRKDSRAERAQVFGRATVKALGPGFAVELAVDESNLYVTPTKPYRRTSYPRYVLPRHRVVDARVESGRILLSVDDRLISLAGYRGLDPHTAISQGPDVVRGSDSSWMAPGAPVAGSFDFREVFRPLQALGVVIVLCASGGAIAGHRPFLAVGFIVGASFQLGVVARTMGTTIFKPRPRSSDSIGVTVSLVVSALTATLPYAIVGMLCLLLSGPFRWVGLLSGVLLAIFFANGLMYVAIARAFKRARASAVSANTMSDRR